jgi:hypothetical protein
MDQLADLQRQIDEATKEVRQLAQDEHDRRLQHRELHQEGLFNVDGWYDDFNHDTFTFDDASPLAAELQAIPWPPSYKPPQRPMYDGHSDPKQFLMSYEATISSYGGNAAVMAKSFVMAVRNVAQTWYSSLRPGTITSWQKLKDMVVTSFQGFQTKPVTAQALFQCTQDHEEYLQAYVRRFLCLRAQVPIVPNEIVIEAMIKGLCPGPTDQYFARKPPQTLEKLLQKMDEYIWADNDFRQRREEAYRFSEMTRGFGGRVHPRHVRSIHNSTQSDDRGSQLHRSQYTSQSSGQQQSSFRPLALRGRGTRGFGGRYGDQPRKIYCLFCGEDKGHTTRMCQITILLLRLVSHRLLGHSLHLRQHYNLPIHEVSSQKGANRPINSEISGRDPKLAQSTVLCQNQNTCIKRYPTSDTFFTFTIIFFLIRNNLCKPSFLVIFNSL